MSSLLNKLRENSKWIFLCIIFVSFLLININVVYLGDDYYYISYKDLSFTEYFSTLTTHYLTTNGRFIVHLLVSFFLKLPIQFWCLLNSFFLTGICFFISKIIITLKSSNKELLIMSIAFFLIASLDIQITRQSTYWLTGSFNYIYPIFMLLAYWFCLLKIDRKPFFIISIFLGFLAAATVEQAGMMTLGLTLLTLLSRFENIKAIFSFKNIKDVFTKNKKLFVLCLTTLFGVCTVVLSPSQLVRINLEENIPLVTKIINNTKFIINNFILNSHILPFSLLFNACTVIYSSQYEIKKNLKIGICASALISTILNIGVTFTVSTSSSIMISPLIITCIILITYFIEFIYLQKHFYKKIISPFTISAILFIGSQFMMLISPVYGPRNLIFGLVMFIFIICFVANSLTLKRTKILAFIFIIFAITFNLKTAMGYMKTKEIDMQNIDIITTSTNIINNEKETLKLYKFPNDNYAWSMPYLSSYHEYWFKNLYDIKSKIDWIDS